MRIQLMSEKRKFQRFVFEFEVEITDPIQARATNLNAHEMTTDAGLQSMKELDPADEVRVALHRLLSDTVTENESRLGVQLLVESFFGRPQDEHGNYTPFAFSTTPGRNEDGTMKRL